MRCGGGDVEASREGALECESDRMLGGGVGRSATPKNSAFSVRAGVVCGNRGVSSVLASERWPLTSDVASEPELMRELGRGWGLGGGRGVAESSANGEPKNAFVLLSVEGDGGGEDTEEAVVYALRCDERVDELSEGHGDRRLAQLSCMSETKEAWGGLTTDGPRWRSETRSVNTRPDANEVHSGLRGRAVMYRGGGGGERGSGKVKESGGERQPCEWDLGEMRIRRRASIYGHRRRIAWSAAARPDPNS